MGFEAPQESLESEAEVGDHLEGVRIRGRRSDMVRAKEEAGYFPGERDVTVVWTITLPTLSCSNHGEGTWPRIYSLGVYKDSLL